MRKYEKYTAPMRGELPSMFWAAFFACLVPISLGFLGLVLSAIPTVFIRAVFQDFMFTVPISLCFAFGTPIVAWLSCRALRRRAALQNAAPSNKVGFQFLEVWPAALKYSFYVHAAAFFTHLLLLNAVLKGGLYGFALFLMFGGLLNLILFLVITLPFSVFCAAIFAMLYTASGAPEIVPPPKAIASRPKERLFS